MEMEKTDIELYVSGLYGLCHHVIDGNEGRLCHVDLQARRECFGR